MVVVLAIMLKTDVRGAQCCLKVVLVMLIRS